MKLRELREQRSVSREQLAAAVGASFPTIVRLESGSKPRIDLAIKIAEYFGVTVESIEWGAKPADDDAGKGVRTDAA